MTIITKFKDIVTKNDKIVSTRLNQKYFINSGNESVWIDFMNSTKNLHEVYPDISSLLVASQESLEVQYCLTCNSAPRMIVRCDKTYKKVLSKYCCSSCASKSIEKSIKLRESLTDDIKKSANDKRRKTMLDKYGVEFNSQRNDIKSILSTPKLPKEISTKLLDENWLKEQYVTKRKSLTEIGDMLGIYYGTVGEYLTKHNISIRPSTDNSFEQSLIKKFLDESGIEYEENNRTILAPKHLDFYIEKYNLAIEWNGDYYHSEDYRDEQYHYNKWLECKDKGIKLIQFYNRDLHNNFEIMKSIIRYHTIGVDRIYARNCVVKEISNQDSMNFQDDNHIQGGIPAQYNHGLYYNDELVAVMTWGKSRYTHKYDLELFRFCNKINTTVVGGASKLLKYFENTINVNSVISYCSLDRSQGLLYSSLGFTLRKTEKSYFWIKSGKRLSRQATTKPKIKKMFGDDYDDEETQEQNMRRLGWRKVYPAGNYVFVKEYN